MATSHEAGGDDQNLLTWLNTKLYATEELSSVPLFRSEEHKSAFFHWYEQKGSLCAAAAAHCLQCTLICDSVKYAFRLLFNAAVDSIDNYMQDTDIAQAMSGLVSVDVAKRIVRRFQYSPKLITDEECLKLISEHFDGLFVLSDVYIISKCKPYIHYLVCAGMPQYISLGVVYNQLLNKHITMSCFTYSFHTLSQIMVLVFHLSKNLLLTMNTASSMWSENLYSNLQLILVLK